MYIHGIGRMPAEPYGAADTAPTGWSSRERMAGQERGQVGAHTDRADTGPATAVRDAERLVEVEVADVGAELAGSGEADQRVEVGAVDVHLAAGSVDHLAQLADARPRTHRASTGR